MTVVNLAHTSVPDWLADPEPTPPPPDGATYLLVGLGPAGRVAADSWAAGLPGVRIISDAGQTIDEVISAVDEALAEAVVGVRLAVAGPPGACLRLRAAGLAAGLENDELHLAPTGEIGEAGAVDVFCVHCRHVTTAPTVIDEVVSCEGCGRDLVVYHHVSRRLGQFLGYQIDAETPPSQSAQVAS